MTQVSDSSRSSVQPVDTKTVHRRTLRFQSLDEVITDLDAIEAALHAGTLTHTGNWSPGEVCDHLRKFFQFAIDGFPSKAPAPVRWIARMMLKNRATTSDDPLPAGFKLPKSASELLPKPGIADLEGLQQLRTQIDRVLAGERMTQPSPLLGPLTHEEWMVLQLKHFSLHLSFLEPRRAATD